MFRRNQRRVHAGNSVVRPSRWKSLKELKKVAWRALDQAEARLQGLRPAQRLLAKSSKKPVERRDRVRRSPQPVDIGRWFRRVGIVNHRDCHDLERLS
jgi:hypothetical protein